MSFLSLSTQHGKKDKKEKQMIVIKGYLIYHRRGDEIMGEKEVLR